MTRINVGIDPKELPDKLLLAEHREITRVPNAVRRQLDLDASQRRAWVPQRFSLGKGHVRFFYNKLGYLRRRYARLYKECEERGMRVTAKHEAFDGLPTVVMGDYSPQPRDRQLVVERIYDRGFQLRGASDGQAQT